MFLLQMKDSSQRRLIRFKAYSYLLKNIAVEKLISALKKHEVRAVDDADEDDDGGVRCGFVPKAHYMRLKKFPIQVQSMKTACELQPLSLNH